MSEDSQPTPISDVRASKYPPLPPDDLLAIAAKGLEPVEPDVFFRRDMRALFYSGKINGIFGASESGKSMVCICAAADEINEATRMGHRRPVVVAFDYEDDGRTWLTRLRDAGISPEDAATYTLHYSIARGVSTVPDDYQGADTARLVIVDTTNAAMTADGLDPLSNADSLAFIEKLRRLQRSSSAAWVLVDHEPHTAGKGRKAAIGAQSKLGAVDGALYRTAAIEQPVPGSGGAVALSVTKDRPGGSRRYAANVDDHGIQLAATLRLYPVEGESTRFRYMLYEPHGGAVDTELRETILAVSGASMSKNQIREAVRANGISRRNELMDEAVTKLAADGLMESKPHANYTVFRALSDAEMRAKKARPDSARRDTQQKLARNWGEGDGGDNETQ